MSERKFASPRDGHKAGSSLPDGLALWRSVMFPVHVTARNGDDGGANLTVSGAGGARSSAKPSIAMSPCLVNGRPASGSGVSRPGRVMVASLQAMTALQALREGPWPRLARAPRRGGARGGRPEAPAGVRPILARPPGGPGHAGTAYRAADRERCPRPPSGRRSGIWRSVRILPPGPTTGGRSRRRSLSGGPGRPGAMSAGFPSRQRIRRRGAAWTRKL